MSGNPEVIDALGSHEALRQWAAVRDINLSQKTCQDLILGYEHTFKEWRKSIERSEGSCQSHPAVGIGDQLRFLVLSCKQEPPHPRPEIPANRICYPFTDTACVMYQTNTHEVDPYRYDSFEPNPYQEIAVRKREDRISSFDCNEVILP